jgi:hypothetical protein
MPATGHGNYGQVPPPELQLTPAAQLVAPPPVQETSPVDPLQWTVSAHESWSEQRTTLVPAVVLIPCKVPHAP